MHRSEADSLIHCSECGSEISLNLDRTYAVTEDEGMCFACAIQRGGVYDELHDSWTQPPTLSSLAPLRQS
jgi:hypothetical protein